MGKEGEDLCPEFTESIPDFLSIILASFSVV